jgi:hypothetical protein
MHGCMQRLLMPNLQNQWPHCDKQLDSIRVVLERWKSWKAITEDLISFITTTQSISAEASKSYAQLTSHLQVHSSAIGIGRWPLIVFCMLC